MSRRIDQPDTAADVTIRGVLTGENPQNFVMVSGAGSGKTTSLVKALASLLAARNNQLQRRGQKVACITYTEVAAGEIWADVGINPIFHVSTIHSFLWEVVRPFQRDIRDWVFTKIEERVSKLREEQAGFGPRIQQKRRDRVAAEIRKLEELPNLVKAVKTFRYGTGSDYENGSLGHSDILRLGADLIQSNETFRILLSQRFPFVFVDESQDTDPSVIEALRSVARTAGRAFCLGFFGDPMQKIYLTGIGEIPRDADWIEISKPENFRCPSSVLSTINRIRELGPNDLTQTGGRKVRRGEGLEPVIGTSRIFIAPADNNRVERVTEAREWLSLANEDPMWISNNFEDDVRVLVVAHRMAARRLGFGALYSALHDKVSDSISQGFDEGTFWGVKPFLDFVLPVIDADAEGKDFFVVSELRKTSPLLNPMRVRGQNLGEVLDKLQRDLLTLREMLGPQSPSTVADVVEFIGTNETFELDERLIGYAAEARAAQAMDDTTDTDDEGTGERKAMLSYLAVAAHELRGYRTYLQSQTPFATQQGIKGAEFSRVLVIADDEEGRHNQFSYNKLFGVTPLSADDIEKQAKGLETQVERTRRLFYVCCSRAERDLAVIFFTPDPVSAAGLIMETGYFDRDSVVVFTDGRFPTPQ